jgi:hypothetical protein
VWRRRFDSITAAVIAFEEREDLGEDESSDVAGED